MITKETTLFERMESDMNREEIIYILCWVHAIMQLLQGLASMEHFG